MYSNNTNVEHFSCVERIIFSKRLITFESIYFQPVSVEHLIALLTPSCFQIPLTLIFARKVMLNMGRVLLTLSC